MAWLPSETAPRDGQTFIGIVRGLGNQRCRYLVSECRWDGEQFVDLIVEEGSDENIFAGGIDFWFPLYGCPYPNSGRAGDQALRAWLN